MLTDITHPFYDVHDPAVFRVRKRGSGLRWLPFRLNLSLFNDFDKSSDALRFGWIATALVLLVPALIWK